MAEASTLRPGSEWEMAHNRPKILIKPNVRDGSNATEMDYPSHVRFPSDSDRIADIAACLKRANNRH
jgi:hypothetical protein